MGVVASWRRATGLLLVLLPVYSTVAPSSVVARDKTGNATNVHVLAGGSATLSCNLQTPIEDQVLLIIWYRHNNETPVYSYDVRSDVDEARLTGSGAPPRRPSQWADAELGERVHLRVRADEAQLLIENIVAGDEGTYRCRVDFQHSPTRNSFVTLIIVVAPRELAIEDWTGRQLKGHVSPPLPEGSSANVTCIALGGKPLSRLTWWRSGELIDDTDDVFEEKSMSKNSLHISRLHRRDLLTTYTCQAFNSELREPSNVRFAIEMYLRPLDVRLTGAGGPLHAGRTRDISCSTSGSRPPATVTWWKDGLALDADVHNQISEDGNLTVSTLRMVPQVSDHGLTLSCRAHNPHIPFSELRTTTMLHVQYAPQAFVKLGPTINASRIREGVDVYFECHIKANPAVHRVSWRHNGHVLHNNISAGVIVTNQTVVLQRISRSSSGRYTCVAANSEGESESEPLQFSVKYEPICGQHSRTVYGTGRQEQVQVDCYVDGDPAVTLFRWSFNHTPAGGLRDLTSFQVDPVGGHSVANFTPMFDSDYGTLLCWGHNEIGTQQRPCIFHVVPLGKPDAPYNCNVSNRSHDTLDVACARAFSGGLSQFFQVVVMAGDRRELVANDTAYDRPEFHLTGLPPDAFYTVYVYAINEKGRSKSSKPLFVPALPLVLQKQSNTPASSSEPPNDATTETPYWMYILAILVALGVTASVLVVACYFRQRKVFCKNQRQQQQQQQYSPKDGSSMRGSGVVAEDGESKQKYVDDKYTMSIQTLCDIAGQVEDKQYQSAVSLKELYQQQQQCSSQYTAPSFTIAPCQMVPMPCDGRLDLLPTPTVAVPAYLYDVIHSPASMTPPLRVQPPPPLDAWNQPAAFPPPDTSRHRHVVVAATEVHSDNKQHAGTQTPAARHKESCV